MGGENRRRGGRRRENMYSLVGLRVVGERGDSCEGCDVG